MMRVGGRAKMSPPLRAHSGDRTPEPRMPRKPRLKREKRKKEEEDTRVRMAVSGSRDTRINYATMMSVAQDTFPYSADEALFQRCETKTRTGEGITVGGAAGGPASPVMDDHTPARAMPPADDVAVVAPTLNDGSVRVVVSPETHTEPDVMHIGGGAGDGAESSDSEQLEPDVIHADLDALNEALMQHYRNKERTDGEPTEEDVRMGASRDSAQVMSLMRKMEADAREGEISLEDECAQNIVCKLETVLDATDGEITDERLDMMARLMLVQDMPVYMNRGPALARGMIVFARASYASRKMSRALKAPAVFGESDDTTTRYGGWRLSSALVDGVVRGVIVIAQGTLQQTFDVPHNVHYSSVDHTDFTRWIINLSEDGNARVTGTVYISSNHEMIPCMIPPGSTAEQAAAHVVRVGEAMRKVKMDKQKQDALFAEVLARGDVVTPLLLGIIQREASISPDGSPVMTERADVERRWREYTVNQQKFEERERKWKAEKASVDMQYKTFTDSRRVLIAEQYAMESERTAQEMERCRLEANERAVERGYAPQSKSTTKVTDVNCVICLAHERSVLLTPCNHVCVCRGCWDQWRAEHPMHTPCPMCRAVVYHATNVHL